MTELPEWEVSPVQPMTVSGADEQQAADEAFRLWSENPEDPDPTIRWWVRPAEPYHPDPWQPVCPKIPMEDINADPD